MTPREKAIELYNKFYDLATVVIDMKVKKYVTKQCAIIHVQEIFNIDFPCYPSQEDYDQFANYWQEVQQEIEKL